MTRGPSSSYVHGTDPREQRRLSRLNELLNRSSLAELSLRPGDHVLDVGSGLGQLACAMAQAVGERGRVVGVERSHEQLAAARRHAKESGVEARVEFRAG